MLQGWSLRIGYYHCRCFKQRSSLARARGDVDASRPGSSQPWRARKKKLYAVTRPPAKRGRLRTIFTMFVNHCSLQRRGARANFMAQLKTECKSTETQAPPAGPIFKIQAGFGV